MIKYILTDIEGTTTRISFVKDILFPYAYEKMESFLESNKNDGEINTILSKFSGDVFKASNHFKDLIKNDVKDPDLKSLQGHIWKEGYDSGKLIAHLYPDVVPMFKKWLDQGVKLGIYSSGSVGSQKLLFGHTEEGNINPLLSHYFDLKMGKKFELESYQKILFELNLHGQEVIFLSDIEAELDAALANEMHTYRLFREVDVTESKHKCIKSFSEINLAW